MTNGNELFTESELPVDELPNLLFWNGVKYINTGETIDDISTIDQKKEKLGTVTLLCDPDAPDEHAETNLAIWIGGIIYRSESDEIYLEDRSGKLWVLIPLIN